MSPYITKHAYAVFKSELVYTAIVCVAVSLWLNTDNAKANIIPGWIPYFKTANVIIIYICIVFSAKKIIDFRSAVKKIVEKGDLEEEREQ